MCRKRHSTSSISPHQENSVSKFSEIRSNAALFLENIKQEVENFDVDYLERSPAKSQSVFKRRSSIDSRGISEVDVASDSTNRAGVHSIKAFKLEDDGLVDSGDTTFTLFASLLDSAIQGA